MRTFVLSMDDRPETQAIWDQVRDANFWTYIIYTGNMFRTGDEFFVWWAERGWVARLIATGDAVRKPNLPSNWLHDPSRVKGGVPFRVLHELSSPIDCPSVGTLSRDRFTKSLPRLLDPDEIDRLRDLMPEVSQAGPLDGPGPVATTSGTWSTDQDLIDKVEAAAVLMVREYLRSRGWTETRDCQKDGVGYDLLYRDPSGIERPVEVKGTTGSETRFILTAKEHTVITTDLRARIFLVTEALTAPAVQEIDISALEDLDVRPERWSVRPSVGLD